MPIEQKNETIKLEETGKEQGKVEKERVIEDKQERKEIQQEKISKKPARKIVSGDIEKPSKTPVKNPVLVKIENVLEEDLGEIYFSLDEKTKKEFKVKGEETASEIKSLGEKAKATVSRIFELIKEWLKIIPGINKFFIEKEAKIKSDKIFKLIQKNDY